MEMEVVFVARADAGCQGRGDALRKLNDSDQAIQ
jgi:hypothetical protein